MLAAGAPPLPECAGPRFASDFPGRFFDPCFISGELCNGIVWASFEPALDLAAMWRGCGNGQGEQPLSAGNIIAAWKSCDALLQCTRNAFVPKSGNRQRSLLRRNGNDLKMLLALRESQLSTAPVNHRDVPMNHPDILNCLRHGKERFVRVAERAMRGRWRP